MTVQNPPIFIQGQTHPAEDTRRFIGALTGDQAGILLDADLAVSQHAGTANMSVDIAGGRCFLVGSEFTYQGSYLCENRGVATVGVSAADAVNARNDLVVARVQESYYSGATNAWALQVIAGTPSGSPVDPAVPVSSITLARIVVAANATSIVNANITDLRSRWDSWRKPRLASATSNLTTTSTTLADVPGATLTFTTPRPNVTVVVEASFDMNADASTISQGSLVVDGSVQTASIYSQAIRAGIAQRWVVTLAAAGSHTVKLQGARVSGNTTIVGSVHTTIAVTNFF